MPLIILLALATIFISATAAFFSVFGLSQLFIAASTATIIMGSSLEAGKLIAVSFLFQFWNKIGISLRTCFIFAIIGLMTITSVGIFGFLSAAYQTDSIDYKIDSSRVDYLTKEKANYESRLSAIDQQIQEVPSHYVSKKIQLIKTLNAEKIGILNQIDQIDKELSGLTVKTVHTQTKVGPIIYVAKALGKSIDDTTIYLILLIMCVFDPLAIMFTLATNVAIKDRNNKMPTEEVKESVQQPLETVNNNLLQPILDKLDQISNKKDKRAEIINSIRDI